MKKISARHIISAVFTALFSGAVLFVRDYSFKGIWVALIIGAIWFAITLLSGNGFFLKLRDFDRAAWKRIDSVLSEKMLFINAFLIGFFVFLLGFFAFYPGIFGYDAPLQYEMFTGVYKLDNSQQPLLHTLFLGAVISFGKLVFKNAAAGFALLVFIQGILIVLTGAKAVIFLKRRFVSPIVTLFSFVWVLINPCIGILNCNVTKDVLFGVFFMNFIMAFADVMKEENTKTSDTVRMVVYGILLCLFRNGLVHALFIAGLVCLIIRIKKKVLYIALAAVILFVHLFSFVADVGFGVKKSPLKEFFAVPIQQMTYTAYKNPGAKVTEKEIEKFGSFFINTAAADESFLSNSADGPKLVFDDTALKKDLPGFLFLYISMGVKNFSSYLNSWLLLERPFFNMNLNEYRSLSIQSFASTYFDTDRLVLRKLAKPLKNYRNHLVNGVDTNIAFIFEPFLCFMLVIFLFARAIANKEKANLPILTAVLIYIVGILLGPVALLRYTYPLMLMFPLLAGLLFQSKNLE
ncbi:MAG: DUF6020 family protein [Lachnospiraceae bacterium]|nr:DUF6020 family protein [Lachnospiraceae bacterium]